MLVKGSKLTDAQRALVLRAFLHRWTIDNPRREEVWRGGGRPTIPPTTDAEWLAEHAFYFIKDGSRLMANRHYAEPAYLAEEVQP